ncbi:hypothetical protein BDV11DRAFT_214855 [Aspergillus similis]
MDALTQDMQSIHLGNEPLPQEPAAQLLFNPLPDSGISSDALKNIPRYLFRIVSPRSDGETDAEWMRSDAAARNTVSSRADIFTDLNPQNRSVIACTLNRHLRWWVKDEFDDNFVSWTSSLLFALQYIYYRHQSKKDRSSLDDIRLYTFLCDLDLINAFCGDISGPSDKDLKNLKQLRTGGTWYFGEYLSQGSLRIADRHQCIRATSLFQDGLLYRLQLLFPNIHTPVDGEPGWAKEVIRFREKIWPPAVIMPSSLPIEEIRNRLTAVGEIMRLFDPGWRFPLAVYFASLIEPAAEDLGAVAIGDFFRSEDIQAEIEHVTFSEFRIIAPDTMPELTRAKEIVHRIYMDFLASRVGEFVTEAKMLVRHLYPQHMAELENAFPITGPERTIFTRRVGNLLSRLGQLLC